MGSVFRKWYGQVGHIRSFVPTSTPVVALTATATKETCALIVNHMQMTELHLVHLSPNRPNIRYSVVKVSREFDRGFQWLTAELCEKRQNLDRVLVYCLSITTCTHLYKLFLSELQEHSCDPPSSRPNIKKQLFAMFHSRVDDEDKVKIMDSMKDPAGTCRVLFYTIAFAMGVDIPNVRTVIHYGPPTDVDDYVQESGCAGRDGFPSNAILYRYPGCTLGHISHAMKKYTINDNMCRRTMLLHSFEGQHDTSQLYHHSCCDVCEQDCKCANPCRYEHVCAEEPTPLGIEDHDDLPTPVRNPTPGQLQELERRLHALREEKLNVNVPLYVGHDIASGFPTYVVNNVMFHMQYVACPDICLVWSYLQKMMEIILKFFK